MPPRCDLSNAAAARSFWQRLARWLPSPRLDQYFVVDGQALTVPVELRSQVLDRPATLLRLFDLARSKKLNIDPSLLEDIHRHAEMLSVEGFRTPETGAYVPVDFSRAGHGENLGSHASRASCWRSWCRPSRACVD